MTPDEALAAVLRPGQDIVIGQGFGTPRTLLAALARHGDRMTGSRVFVGMLVGDLPRLPGAELSTFFPSGALGTEAGLRERGARYVRSGLHALAAGFRSGERQVDVALGQATPARDGRHSLGATVDYFAVAAERAAAVVLETSPDVPWSGPSSTFAADGAITVEGSGPEVLDRAPSGRDEALAEHVARWIPDGATLQLGLGPWAAAVAGRLTGRRGLRVHTGLVSDWVAELEAAGALDPDATVVGTGAGGTRAFYGWLDASDRVDIAPALTTHAPERLRELPRLRAVNSVLEIDLEGRVNSEFGGDGRRGGVAGLHDFAAGATANPSGLSIVAVAATVRGRSRIVRRLPDDAVATDAVDVIVTEHGSVDLRGLPPAQRAEAIAAVAAPEHRAGLR